MPQAPVFVNEIVGKVTLSGLDACQPMHVSLPGPGELSYRKIPNNSRGIYLFQSLNRPGLYLGPGSNMEQAFNFFLSKIWDENVTNFASFSVNSLAILGNSCLLQVKLLRQRKRFSQPALPTNFSSLLSLTVVYICFATALIILRDTLSWHACFLITHSRMCISSSLLPFFLPPPGSLALLLSS